MVNVEDTELKQDGDEQADGNSDKYKFKFCNEWKENDVDLMTVPIYLWEQKCK